VWVDGNEITPTPRGENPLVGELGLERNFVVAYIGNAGLAHDFDALLAAMRELKDDPRIYFLFIGDGPRRARIEAFAREHCIENYSYHGYYPRERINSVYGLADVHVVTLGAPFVGIAIPTKCYVSMATARPVLFIGPEKSETADAIRDADGGAIVDPAQPGAAGRISALLRSWSSDPHTTEKLGRQGREAVLNRYSREANCRAIEAVVNQQWGDR
jgi:colanic acid biosynthesis glycosyl transferase WcaI